uniref:Uncharacterized protein n=1 Tax=Anguilla anguilla TaxID=7936 RepID=A0A0E9Q365_ANGAN
MSQSPRTLKRGSLYDQYGHLVRGPEPLPGAAAAIFIIITAT